MSVVLPVNDHERVERELIEFAISLLSQQVWCWGRDVVRPEGNWLLELGFDRIQPPADRKDCSSVYTLQLPEGRRVVLRGFGVFFGADQHGGVFLPRYEFRPKYTTHATLECPAWTDSDLPALSPPTQSQRTCCATLTLELLDWIRSYEANLLQRLGVAYRRATLIGWDNGKRSIIPAEESASAWRDLSFRIAANLDVILGPTEA